MDKKKLYLLLGVDQFDNPAVIKVLGYEPVDEKKEIEKDANGMGVEAYTAAVKPRVVVVDLP
jgi:hypothetical protein